MNAPLVWIGLPLLLALLLWLPLHPKTTALLGSASALFLALLALILPIDVPIRISENLSIKLAASIEILGREIVITAADQTLLALLYGIAALWFFGSGAAGVSRRLVPFGMTILALLIASLAVTPFLYAALIIQTAILIAVPLLLPPEKKPGRGVIRFLIYQTLAMPFILFSGWLLAGVESSPGDIELITQAATLLALGFAFLLAVFPLYTWIPLLMEETSPYIAGFILWLFPTATLLFALGFLDRFAWLREFAQLPIALQLAGLIMITTGGFWAAFERHLGRIMGYAAIINTGFSLLAISLIHTYRLSAFFMLLIPQALSLLIWAFALSALKKQKSSLTFKTMQGILQEYPIIAGGLLLAHFSSLGMPLLAGFPPILSIWEGMAREKMVFAFWVAAGIASLLTSALRSLAVFIMSSEKKPWQLRGSLAQNIFMSAGIILLVLLGLFPQLVNPILINIPNAFEHFGG